MEKEWLEIRLPVPTAAADMVGQALADIGCSGVIVEERRLDTFTPPDPDEVVSEEYRLRAFFPATLSPEDLMLSLQSALARLSPLFPPLATASALWLPVKTEDWAEGWKQHFPLLRIGRRLVIRPTWEAYTPEPEEAVVVLDPGMAFGTGTHGTTRLCLEALTEAFETDAPPRRVLDVGAGSGILAIAAAALGAERVVACEIDPEACQTSRENVTANGVHDRVETTDQPVENLEGSFQLVLANILAEELVRLGPELAGRLTPGGLLVLSGILPEKEPLVVDGFSSFGLQGPEIRRLDDWSCLLYRRPACSASL